MYYIMHTYACAPLDNQWHSLHAILELTEPSITCFTSKGVMNIVIEVGASREEVYQ